MARSLVHEASKSRSSNRGACREAAVQPVSVVQEVSFATVEKYALLVSLQQPVQWYYPVMISVQEVVQFVE
jgi:hypothetical protein